MNHDPEKLRSEILDALRKRFPAEVILQVIADLPPDAQERIRREFAPRPVNRRFKFIDTRRKKP
jgi:hypothetical protein